MRVTKHEHACLVVEEQGHKLVVDPGMYSERLPELTNVVALTLSHVHDDHSFRPHVEKLLEQFPEIKIFGTQEVAEKLKGLTVTVVYHVDRYEVGPFTFDFFGYFHQEIHRSIPLVQNFGLMVNSELYYPGDSYTIPEVDVGTLACPSSAPWLKIGDVIDFVSAVKPRRSFPTHNALLSEHGHKLQNSRIQELTESFGGEFRYLEVGQGWEL
jgi:L-ascorbate metabolism protein UlaG (beta-lactamase superfamily)